MNPYITPKTKVIHLRRWTVATLALMGITFILLIFIWYIGRDLATPVAWTKDIGSLESAVSLQKDTGFIIGSKNNELVKLDKSGDVVWTVKTTGTVKDITLSKDEMELAAVTEDRFLYIMDTANGKMKKSLPIPYPAIAVAWNSEGQISVSAGTIIAGKYRIYTFNSAGTQVWKYESNVDLRTLAYSPDGQILFVGTNSSRVIALNNQGKPIWQALAKAPIYGISVVGDRVVYADNLGAVGALDFQGKAIWTESYNESFIDVTASPSGTSLMLLDEKGNLNLISAETGKEITQLPLNNGAKHIHLDLSGKNLIAVGDHISLVHVAAMQSFDSSSSLHSIFIILAIIIGFIAICILTLRLMFSSPKMQQSILLTVKLTLKNKIAYLLILPTLFMLALFNYYPAYSAFYHSFTDWKPGLHTIFVGFDQFIKVFNSHYFWIGINNLFFLLVSRFLQLAAPLLVALMIFHLRSERAKYFMRNLFVYPLVVPSIVGILLWLFIYDRNFGVLNQVLAVFGLENLQHAWLGESATAMPALAFIGFPWIGAFALLIFYGGLISISSEVFEAGIMDGIGKFRRFWNIELPLLMGQMRLLLILTFIGTMQDFSLVYVTTQGGPFDSTYLPALELFFAATRFNDYGYASAMGIVLFMFILVGTIFQIRIKTSDQ
ncbi:ABC transporter permease subunit [Paenibacillus psychroresistens]|uniref:ABC transporter permease subunit n=1 Tax=Paenibacillus psychroresistens TaxID=1778678 RepID=A0A6B8RUB6_9BACL|nr:PQQ-binding-like beta-propeller repeat protein [Paenibacillus psychroresistens]QGQ99043.1 ABC transporter permease subunit [Paenibacillus psychroresistens]